MVLVLSWSGLSLPALFCSVDVLTRYFVFKYDKNILSLVSGVILKEEFDFLGNVFILFLERRLILYHPHVLTPNMKLLLGVSLV